MIKGKLILSLGKMEEKGDCMNCPIAVWEPDWDYGPEVYWCPLVSGPQWWEKCPMEFIEVEE